MSKTSHLPAPATPAADLRSAAQDSKRDADHKHKWENGAIGDTPEHYQWDAAPGRAPASLRPNRTVFPKNHNAHWRRDHAHNLGKSRKHNVLDGATYALTDTTSYHNATLSPQDPPTPLSPTPRTADADAGVYFSFDAARGPETGASQLQGALDRALERAEDRRVLKEYDVLDPEGESLTLEGAGQKAQRRLRRQQLQHAGGAVKEGAKGVSATLVEGEDEYEFV